MLRRRSLNLDLLLDHFFDCCPCSGVTSTMPTTRPIKHRMSYLAAQCQNHGSWLVFACNKD
eukprot:4032302-Amphidinium_carterae.1